MNELTIYFLWVYQAKSGESKMKRAKESNTVIIFINSN